MNGLKIRLSLRVPYGLLYAGLIGACLALVPTELSSESVTLSTYYPAPSGIYSQMMSASQTWLARDGGGVGIGTAAPPSSGLVVMGGNVGIGTASASQALDISGGGLTVIGTNAAVQLGSNANALAIAGGAGAWSSDTAVNDVVLRASGQVAVNSAITINTGNQVGINKTSPSQALDVGGDVVVRPSAACRTVTYGFNGADCPPSWAACGCNANEYATWMPGVYNIEQNQNETWNPAGGSGGVDNSDNTSVVYDWPGWGAMACCPIPTGMPNPL